MSSSDDEYNSDVEENVQAQLPCVFCQEVNEGIFAFVRHCEEAHGLSIAMLVLEWELDTFKQMKLLNYLRKQDVTDFASANITKDHSLFDDESNLVPHEKDHALMMALLELEHETESEDKQQVNELQSQVSACHATIKDLQDRLKNNFGLANGNETEVQPAAQEGAINQEEEGMYFENYAYTNIHEEMLKDKVRTEAYRDFMYKNPEVLKDKIVLDVGCGTGILSLFAAKAGAKHVYGIDFSDTLNFARKIIQQNGYEDKITLIKGKVEDVELPCKVDIIISEWMGYFLIYENMIESVLLARDRFLAPGGCVYPDKADIFVTLFENKEFFEKRIEWWKDVYGFDMTAMQFLPMKEISEPVVNVFNSKTMASKAVLVKSYDITNMKVEDIDFHAEVKLKADRDMQFHGFLTHFDCFFSRDCSTEVVLLTGADHPETHWAQTAFYLKDLPDLKKDDDVNLRITACRNAKHHRHIDITFDLSTENKASVQAFTLE